jgi:hypothetical protein
MVFSAWERRKERKQFEKLLEYAMAEMEEEMLSDDDDDDSITDHMLEWEMELSFEAALDDSDMESLMSSDSDDESIGSLLQELWHYGKTLYENKIDNRKIR